MLLNDIWEITNIYWIIMFIAGDRFLVNRIDRLIEDHKKSIKIQIYSRKPEQLIELLNYWTFHGHACEFSLNERSSQP